MISQEIMLSKKKMVIGQSSIDFLGVSISDGKYTLQPHIAVSLSEFLDKLTSANRYNSFLELLITCPTSSQGFPDTGTI